MASKSISDKRRICNEEQCGHRQCHFSLVLCSYNSLILQAPASTGEETYTIRADPPKVDVRIFASPIGSPSLLLGPLALDGNRLTSSNTRYRIGRMDSATLPEACEIVTGICTPNVM